MRAGGHEPVDRDDRDARDARDDRNEPDARDDRDEGGGRAIAVVATTYGPPATEALRRVVASAKAGDPFAPVTVVVPANSVGVAVRRALARGADGERRGIVGLSLLTVYRLAELLGAPALAAAGRRPVTTPVVGAAVRRVLASDAGPFRPVAAHPATEEAIVRAHRELSDLDGDQLDAVAALGGTAAAIVRVHRAVRDLLQAEFYEERDLMDAAVAALGRAGGHGLATDLGHVVVHLPQRLGRPAARLVRAVAAVHPMTLVIGLTGDAGADAEPLLAARRLGVEPPAPAEPIVPAKGTHVVSTSDPDDEVRHVVREVVRAAIEGVPLERMAIVYSAPVPYTRLLHERLTAAGIPHNVAEVRAPADGVAGRTLLGLLALPASDFARSKVAAVLASAPVRDGAGPVPSATWERLGRQAGVVRGLDQWRIRLAALLADIPHGHGGEEPGGEPGGTAPTPRQQERRAHIERLAAFIERLGRDLDPARWRGGWRAHAQRCRALLARYLGDDRHRAAWPEQEVELAHAVDLALARLATLDRVEPDVALDVFRRALEVELTTARGRIGQLGDGVLVGPAGMAIGVDLERVFVVGLAEGTFPARRRDDSLLPDAAREAAAPDLPRRAERTAREHRELLAVLASTAGARVLCFPRGDLRRSTAHTPSRWLLDTVEHLTGQRAYGDVLHDLAHRGAPWCTLVASHVDGLSRLTLPATGQEYDVRALLGHASFGGRLDDHPLARTDPVLARSLECVRARAGPAFTRFDGNLAGCGVASPCDPGALTSATQLEAWASNPFEYLMGRVLEVEIPEAPEDALSISPADRGSLVHEALERFLREVLARGAPEPGEPWSGADRARIVEIAGEVCARFERTRVTGHRLLWERAQEEIRRDLLAVLARDDARRAQRGLRPIAAELAFGMRGGTPPVEIPLSDGRALRLRGSIDRIDRADDGTIVVVDYKTGRAYQPQISAGDPDRAGRLLQLFVYAHAARAAVGDPAARICSTYWFISPRGGFAEQGYEITDAIAQRFDLVLRTIVDGIAAGAFPCAVEPTSRRTPWITFSDPDRLGTAARAREWEAKRDDPALAGYRALAEAPRLELGQAP
jgi:ATP-dependent helicase/nuclease subunit B